MSSHNNMLRDIYTENSFGEFRAGVFEQDRLVEYYCTRPHETDFWIGYSYTARIISKQAGFSIVAMDNVQAILRPAPYEPEGADIAIEITRLAIPEPGQQKLMEVKRATPDVKYRNGYELRVPIDNVRSEIRASAHHTEQFQDCIDLALAGYSTFLGGSITWERTRAGMVFDIDGVSAARALNIAAAHEIARLLRLFQIGGSVMIDFVAMENKADRLSVAQAFDAASKADPRTFERTAINGYGLCQIIRARPGPSLIDTLIGTNSKSPCTETFAVQLVRDAASSQGAGTRTLTTTPAIAQLLETPAWAEECCKLEKHLGAPVQIVAQPRITGYGYVHVTPV
jgi:ribonuclease G